MDKEIENDEKHNDAADEVVETEEVVEYEADITAEDKANDNKPEVVRKSGGGLSLLLSLMALGLAGFTFYQQWQVPGSPNQSAEISPLKNQLQQLAVTVESNTADLTEQNSLYSGLNRQTSELSVQLSELANQEPQNLIETGELTPFDNSANELALEQLRQQLQQQQNLISQLQQQLTQQPTIAQEDLVVDESSLQRTLAVRALLQAQMLVDVGNSTAAIETLERFLLVTKLDVNSKSKIGRMVNALKQVNQPDLEQLRSDLKSVNQSVDEIQLTVVESQLEANWYDRFISVKKIDDAGSVASTTVLIELKAALKRKLYEAQLFLNLQDQVGWANSVADALQIIKDKLPNQHELIDSMESLATAMVVAEIPTSFDTRVLIDEFNGLR